MSNLFEHLAHFDHSTLFPGTEFNNAIRFIYTALGAAVSDGADTFVIKSNGFEWYRNGSFVDKYLGGDSPLPKPSYNINFHKMMERDGVLGKHLKIVTESSEETTISIKYE
jgi:hypothetical protein